MSSSDQDPSNPPKRRTLGCVIALVLIPLLLIAAWFAYGFWTLFRLHQ
jgi:nitrate reductase NapE component